MKGISKEAEISIAASSMFPGFRFSPTDEELILYYLKNKLDGLDKCVEVIPLLDICKFEPWDLPAKAIIKSDQEWFFFSPRGRKYPNGSQSKRATEIGYWKATGKERAVKSGSNIIGTKRTLVFHIGRAPKGERTEWIMHEYCKAENGQDDLVVCRLRKKLDYHGEGQNPEIGLSKPSSLIDGKATFTNAGLDLIGPSGVNKPEECEDGSMKKCSSSHDSHSVEQTDSASDSDHKFKVETQHNSSSSHHDDEDLFADILNDNIVQLDESPPNETSPVQQANPTTSTGTVSVVPRTYGRTGAQHDVPRGQPSQQGLANRRIRLRKPFRITTLKDELVEGTGENSPRYNARASTMKNRRFRLRRRFGSVYVVVIVMIMVVLMLCSLASWYVSWPSPQGK